MGGARHTAFGDLIANSRYSTVTVAPPCRNMSAETSKVSDVKINRPRSWPSFLGRSRPNPGGNQGTPWISHPNCIFSTQFFLSSVLDCSASLNMWDLDCVDCEGALQNWWCQSSSGIFRSYYKSMVSYRYKQDGSAFRTWASISGENPWSPSLPRHTAPLWKCCARWFTRHNRRNSPWSDEDTKTSSPGVQL